MTCDLKIQAACTRIGCPMFAGGICATCGVEVPAGYGEPGDDLKERLQGAIDNPTCMVLTAYEWKLALARIEQLEAEKARLQAHPSERYWEGRWRDEKAENDRLQAQLAESDATIDAFSKVSPQQYEKEIAGLKAQLAAAREALEFYRDGFRFIPKRTKAGIDLSIWKPKDVLLEDCGERASAALATAPATDNNHG